MKPETTTQPPFNLQPYFEHRASGKTPESFTEIIRADVNKDVMSKFDNPKEAGKAATALVKSRISDLKKALHSEAGEL